MKILLTCWGLILIFSPIYSIAQWDDSVYSHNIETPQLYLNGNQLSFPIIHLNGTDQMEVEFDDLDADVKAYYYSFQLCDADWTPVNLSEMDYIQGFSQVRISDYRFSSLALTKYTHYRAPVPDPNCLPTKSGNYILKVFLNGDTAQLAFTKRFLVMENGVGIFAQFLQPFDPQYSRTHQKLQINVNTLSLNVANPMQQIKMTVMQNDRWGTAITGVQPTFYSGNNLQYNRDDDFVFQGGMEWRWLDLQALHYQSDRIQHGVYNKTSTDIYVKPDRERGPLPYYFYMDNDGGYFIQTTESINPFWQTDYATVHFAYMPPGNSTYPNTDLYLISKITDFKLNDSTKMKFDADKGLYECSLFLKQGFYNYAYVTVDQSDPSKKASFSITEGNHFETENNYSILVYYRDLGGRYDHLVGYLKINTLTGK